ncbi:hypothetical protein V7S43_017685 [Phytophthora oleae]|uniref:Uncharacterized protein n=1 Tax=Phytophthora oleae TaxID=2107226 RepID=A0ABD3ESN4_9STRA
MPLEYFPAFRQDIEPTARTKAAVATFSQAPVGMANEFYSSTFGTNDTSTTIIFNVFRGESEALQMQLEAAFTQKGVTPPDVYVL